MSNPSRPLSILVSLLAFAVALPAQAAIEAGVEFEELAVVESNGPPARLELCATGLLRYRRIFKGYAAALYRGDCTDGRDPLDDTPKRLELSYFWSIDGEMFGTAAESLLRRNLDEEEFASLEPRIRRLHAAYLPVAPGDRYALTYWPGRGTELALNGRPLARIEGEDFARVYFGIWLGDRPIDEKLRDELLANGVTR